MKFDSNFLIGAATAAHQVEGNNIHSDFWAQEQMKYTSFAEPSLTAVDHYNRFEEDIKLMANAGLNAYRFSIEWARIEPNEGQYDQNEIEHYRKVISCCLENAIEPIVTMHHFTSPKWLITKGGWEAESTIEAFAKYCTYTMEQLGSQLKYVCTINEANMGLQLAAIGKRYMAQMMAKQAELNKNAEKQAESSVQVGINMMPANMASQMQELAQVFNVSDPRCVHTFLSQRSKEGDLLVMRAHEAARDAMKAACPHLKVGVTLSLHDIQPLEGGEAKAAAEWEEEFTHYLPYMKNDDFFGLQNYTRSIIDENGITPAPEGAELTQMNYEFYPQALENVIRAVAKEFKGDIIVTENGIGTADDTRRVAFIEKALSGVQACIADGIPVKGYCHWSLMDNFEWQKGFSMTFGLISVNRETQQRTAKPSLQYLGSFAKS